ncbi:MAG: hypothetical protein P8X57_03960, partial [Cyclobacteriaceae bacterium]
PDRTFYFTPWSDYLFGGRFGDFKVIFNETTGKSHLFNITTDPEELNDIAGEYPEQVESYRQEVASWVQAHDRFIENKIGTYN